MESQTLSIPVIELEWSDWHSWTALLEDPETYRNSIPVKKPGVYEVRLKNQDARLTIGKTTDLNRRIRQALIRENGKHSAGRRIREKENTKDIELRWAETTHPIAAEEELHNLYRTKFGRLPKYTKRT